MSAVPAWRRLARHIGLAIGLVGFAFVTRELMRSWDEIAQAASAAPGAVAGAVALGAFGMTVIGMGWHRSLTVLGTPRPVLDSLYRYFAGELGKYVPGGIWAVVGRGELLQRVGVSRTVAYGSTMLCLSIAYLAAVLTATLALILGATEGRPLWFLLLAIVLAGVVGLHPRVLGAVRDLAGRVVRQVSHMPVPDWGTSIGLLVWHVPAWLAVGGAAWLLALPLQATPPDFRNLLFATALSWTAGLLAVPVPGGIGVRELVFVSTATSLDPGVAAAVAISARVVFVLVDVVAAALFALLNARRVHPGRADGPDPDR